MKRHCVLLGFALLIACDSAGGTVAKAHEGAEAGRALADDAVEGTKSAIDSSKKAYEGSKAAYDQGKRAIAEAKSKWSDVQDSGELSRTARDWLGDAAEDHSTIATVVASGRQIVPVAAQIHGSVDAIVDSERMIEPIYQETGQDLEETGDADPTIVDAAIAGMPRVEVIDGLTVGFQRLDATSADSIVEERGYLVTWREDDHLIGFVYRSRRAIDLDALVAETPRIVGLMRAPLRE